MRKAKRKAVKLETKIKVLTTLKVSGTMDERMYSRKRLNDGLSSRFIKREKISRMDATCVILGRQGR